MGMAPESDTTWDRLATLIRYPGDGTAPVIATAVAGLISQDDALASVLDPFARFIRQTPETELEELYTRTFDINPLCCLEVGWQIHGDTYERGAFLVKMRGLLREHGVPEGTELPDHLGSMLRLVPRVGEAEARELRDVFMLPTVIRMRRSFVSGLGEGNIFGAVLSAIEITLRRETTLPPEILSALEREQAHQPSTAASAAEFGPNGIPLSKEAARGC